MKKMRRLLQDQGGSVLIYVTISMIVLLAFGAGVADMGQSFENRRQLQNAADGAALAGAQELLKFDLSVAQRTALAVNIALDYAQRNGVPASQVDPGYPQVTCVPFPYNNNCDASSDYYYNAVKMTAGRDLNLMVAGLLRSNVGNVSATATAIVAPMLPEEGLWPWGVSNCDDWNGDGKIECGIPQGQRIMLKMSAPPGSPGNFFAMDFPNSSGSSGYRDNIKYGYGHDSGDYIKPSLPWCGADQAPGCTTQDNPYVQTETGNQVGPTLDGVQYLLDMAASSGQDTPPNPCTWPGAPKQVSDPDNFPPPDWIGNVSSCYRVGIVPIIYQRWNTLSGKKPVDIIGWGAFYIIGVTYYKDKGEDKAEVYGYYFDQATVGGGHLSDTATGLWGARLWE